MTGTSRVFLQEVCTVALCLVGLACAPKNTPSAVGTGTLTVDAKISQGTRFAVYCNNVWSAPQRRTVLAGQRTSYTFSLPTPLQSLRLDPSELPDSDVFIYAISIDMPGQPKKALPLTDLPKFIAYHCDIKMQNNEVHVHATGPEMYLMSTVDPASYPPVP